MSEPQIDSQKTKTLDELQSQIEAVRQRMTEIEAIHAKAEEISKSSLAARLNIEAAESNIGEIKGRIEEQSRQISEAKGAIDVSIDSVTQARGAFDTLKSEATKSAKAQAEKQALLDTKLQETQSLFDEIQAIKARIDGFEKQTNDARERAENLAASTAAQHATTQGLLDTSNQRLTEINDKHNNLDAVISDIQSARIEINQLHDILFADVMDTDGVVKNLSTKSKIEVLAHNLEIKIASIENYSKEQAVRFDDLYASLKNKIEELLPSAGAAGLASSYFEAKMRYTAMDDYTAKNSAQASRNKNSLLIQRLTFVFNLFLFIAPLVCIASGVTKVDTSNIIDPYAALLFRFVSNIPWLMVSAYGITQILVNRKLYEAYNHKQRVMELYHSFKKEIDSTEDQNLKSKLLNIMVDVVSEKPSVRNTDNREQSSGTVDTLKSLLTEIIDKINPLNRG